MYTGWPATRVEPFPERESSTFGNSQSSTASGGDRAARNSSRVVVETSAVEVPVAASSRAAVNNQIGRCIYWPASALMRRIFVSSMLVVSLGTSGVEQNVDLVRIEKSSKRLYLLNAGKVVREFKVVVGGNPTGHKQQEGDQRTPERGRISWTSRRRIVATTGRSTSPIPMRLTQRARESAV